MVYLYQAINVINGRTYVGKSTTALPDLSVVEEISEDYAEVGRAGFAVIILEILEDVAQDRWHYWIKFFKAANPDVGYNKEGFPINGMTKGLSPNSGRTYDEMYGEDANRLIQMRVDMITGSKNPRYGKPISDKHRAALKKANTGHGRKISKETRAKMSKAKKRDGSWIIEWIEGGDVVYGFPSVKAAMNYFGVTWYSIVNNRVVGVELRMVDRKENI